jgi:PAS domain-containing protein
MTSETSAPSSDMRRSGERSLQGWLVLFMCAALLPIAGVGAYVIWRTAEQARDATLRQSESQARHVALTIEQRLRHLGDSLTLLGQSPAGQEGRWPELYQQALALTRVQTDVRAVSVVSPVDEVVFVTSLPFGSQTFAPNALDLVRESRQTGRANLSGLFTTPISDRKLVTLTVPVKRVDGQVYALRGVIGAETLSETLREALSAVDLPADWLLSLADRQGQVIARSRDAERFLGRQVSADFLKAIQSRQIQRFESTTLDGFSVSAQALPLHQGDWTLALAVPKVQLQAPFTQARWQIAGWLLLNVGWAFLGSFLLSRWLLKQLQSRPALPSTPHRVATTRWSVREFQAHAQALAVSEALLAAERASHVHDQHHQADHQHGYDHAHWGDVTFSPTGDILQMNPHLRTRLGISSETEPLAWHRFMSAASLETFHRECGHLKPESLADLDVTLTGANGVNFDAWLSIRAATVDGSGHITTLRALVADISERKRVERLLLARLGHASVISGADASATALSNEITQHHAAS